MKHQYKCQTKDNVVCTCSPLTIPSPTQVCPECKKTHCKHYEKELYQVPVLSITCTKCGEDIFCSKCNEKEKEEWEIGFEETYGWCQECGIRAPYIRSLLTRAREEERNRILKLMEGIKFNDTWGVECVYFDELTNIINEITKNK